MIVNVYRKPQCNRCDATEKYLDRQGIEYNEIDVLEDKEGFEFIKAQGFNVAPVVFLYDDEGEVIDAWGDLRPDKLEQHFPRKR